MRNIVCIRFFLLLIGCLFIAPPLTAEQESLRGIVRITGNLYRFQENAHYSVFLVTPEGKAGFSIEELQNSIALDEYRDWDLFDDWRALNIEGMYRQLMRKSNQHQDTGSIP